MTLGIELKAWRDKRSDPMESDIEQLDSYLARLGVNFGWLVVFDLRILHGSQGCTALVKVVLERHFRCSIPLSTTVMTEAATVLGGKENVEQAILTLVQKSQPEIIGLCTAELIETRGDDMGRFVKEICPILLAYHKIHINGKSSFFLTKPFRAETVFILGL